MGIYMIKEEGKNGSVEILEDRIIRTRKKTLGRNDVQTFPIRNVSSVSHDRRNLGSDLVKIHIGSVSYEWKVKNAEEMVAELQAALFTG